MQISSFLKENNMENTTECQAESNFATIWLAINTTQQGLLFFPAVHNISYQLKPGKHYIN